MRHIFRRYVQLGTVAKLTVALAAEGCRTKRYTGASVSPAAQGPCPSVGNMAVSGIWHHTVDHSVLNIRRRVPRGRTINARTETVAEKPAFCAAFKMRRCLIPADSSRI